MIRVVDEEIAAFVPAAKVSSEFVPGRVLVLRGAEHKSDKLKFLGRRGVPARAMKY